MPRSASSVMAPAMSAHLAIVSALARASTPMPVMNCVPLISARPSLACSTSGSMPAAAIASRPGSRRPCHTASPSPIMTDARCASGARSPDAPTDPRLGITGSRPRSSICDQRLEDDVAGARVALGEHVGAQQHQRPGRLGPDGLPDAAAVAQHQVALQFDDIVAGDGHVRELAEAGGDAVDHPAVGDQLLDVRAGRVDWSRAPTARSPPPPPRARPRGCRRASGCCRR